MNRAIRVGIVDDHPLYREGIAAVLHHAQDFGIVAEGDTADCALRMARENAPDLLLLDLHLPGGGISAATRIACDKPQVKVVIITVSEDERDLANALGANVWGYIVKGISGADLVRALRDISGGARYVSPTLAARVLMRNGGEAGHVTARDKLFSLTKRERVVIEHVRQGRTNKEVARLLKLSDKTVKHHMTSIMHKIGVRNRTELAMAVAGSASGSTGSTNNRQRNI